MHEVTEIRIKYPNKIPVVVERYQKEKTLPPLSRTKFLVAQDLPLSQFAITLRCGDTDASQRHPDIGMRMQPGPIQMWGQ
ncbi:hypothetical protein Q9966_016490 [Columba livia]|nr:hypothetical protein Q9966_016490 [Columba livia]